MDNHSKANLERFFGELKPVEQVYADPEFTYLVHNGPKGVALVSARLVLQPLSRDRPDRVIKAANFYGFSGRLKSLDLTPRLLVDMLLDGAVPAPDRTWILTPNEFAAGPHLYRHHNLGDDQAHTQQKLTELMGLDLSMHHYKSDDDEWDLRAAETPYSNMNDLMLELGLPVNSPHQLHMLAFPPLMVDNSSRVHGEIALLKLLRSKHLPVSKTSMGIVVSSSTAVTQRTRISGEKFTWMPFENAEDVLVGTVEIPVEKASIVHCLASYDRQCLHHYWVGDPDASQNARRTVYELFDPKFELATEMLRQSAKGNTDAHEAAVAALLWVLGFAPLLPGRNSDAPDVIAVSQDGNFLVVECTLSDLQTKKQNKPQKLLDRTSDIRAALERSNVGNGYCIPVMVTSRKLEDIKADVEDCERRGIVVYTQDDIEPLVSRTISAPRAELLFAEVRQRLEDAIARVESEERQKREMARDVSEIKKSLKSFRT